MTIFFSLLRKSIIGLDRYPAFLLVTWLVVMLSLPLLQVIFGQQAFLQGMALSVLLQVALVLNILYKSWGWWATIKSAVAVVLLAWAVQAIVLKSGLPYGNFQYSSLLQPHISDVPLIIPFMWLMMLPPAWAVAKLITRKLSGCLMRFVFVATSAIAFTAWSLYLEPVLVHFGVTKWSSAGAYYGIPWLHFTGWLLVSGVITFGISPQRLPGGLLILVYALVWLTEFVSLLIFWGMPGTAIIGFLGMGLMLLLAGIITR